MGPITVIKNEFRSNMEVFLYVALAYGLLTLAALALVLVTVVLA